MLRRSVAVSFLVVLTIGLLGSLVGAADPQYGGTLRFAVDNEPRSLFPANMTGANEGDMFRYAYEGLVQFDENGQIVPELATVWDISEDGMVYTFYLQEGVRFHDGTPFNAEAVKFVFEESIEKTYLIAAFLLGLQNIDVIDEYTVQLEYEEPLAAVMSNLAYFSMAMWSPTAYREQGEDWMVTNCVGTGPFKLAAWEHGDYLLFEKNDDYWQEGLPYLDAVRIQIVPEPANRVMMLQAGQVDRIMGILPQYVLALEADPDIRVRYASETNQTYLAFNTTVHPFDNPLVRRAIAYALDKQGMIDALLGDFAELPKAPMCTIGMVGCSDVTEEGADTIHPYDPALATKLLRFAGFDDRDGDGILEDPKGNDFKLTLWLPNERLMQITSVGQYVQQNLQEIGIDTKLRLWEYGAMSGMVGVGPEEAQYQAFLRGWGSPTNDVDEIMMNLFNSRSWRPIGSNRMFYGNVEVDRLTELSHLETDPATRTEIVAQVLRIIVEEAPIFPLFSTTKVIAEATYVQNSQVLPIYGQKPARFAWLDKD